MMCLTARQQLKYAAMAQETFSQHVPGAQGLKGPPVCIIMSGSANANVTVANPLLFSKYFKIEYIYIYISKSCTIFLLVPAWNPKCQGFKRKFVSRKTGALENASKAHVGHLWRDTAYRLFPFILQGLERDEVSLATPLRHGNGNLYKSDIYGKYVFR